MGSCNWGMRRGCPACRAKARTTGLQDQPTAVFGLHQAAVVGENFSSSVAWRLMVILARLASRPTSKRNFMGLSLATGSVRRFGGGVNPCARVCHSGPGLILRRAAVSSRPHVGAILPPSESLFVWLSPPLWSSLPASRNKHPGSAAISWDSLSLMRQTSSRMGSAFIVSYSHEFFRCANARP